MELTLRSRPTSAKVAICRHSFDECNPKVSCSEWHEIALELFQESERSFRELGADHVREAARTEAIAQVLDERKILALAFEDGIGRRLGSGSNSRSRPHPAFIRRV